MSVLYPPGILARFVEQCGGEAYRHLGVYREIGNVSYKYFRKIFLLKSHQVFKDLEKVHF
jgi:hypothetical protein